MDAKMATLKHRAIGLALSGGGTRAAIFHLGVLRYMAEHGLLERVQYISSVSGGSLLIGLVFRCANYIWPNSTEFQMTTYADIKKILLGPNVQYRYIARLLFLPWNWFRFSFRANVLAETISAAWDVRATLNQLPANPIWAINGTTMETGRRWRFRNETETGETPTFEMGDGELGYTSADDFYLANAMATSAAFPGGVSPLRIPTHDRTWSKPDFSNKAGGQSSTIKPRYRAYHVADGGIYDNLGLEPLYDISQGAIRVNAGCDYLVVSDAGSPLRIRPWHWLPQLLGFSKRTADIMTTATRNLRVRDLIRFLLANPHTGVFLSISQTAERAIATAGSTANIVIPLDLRDYKFLSKDEAQQAANYKTSLLPPRLSDFENIERHGYEVAKIQFSIYA